MWMAWCVLQCAIATSDGVSHSFTVRFVCAPWVMCTERRDDDGWVCELYLRFSIWCNTITSFVIVIIIIFLCVPCNDGVMERTEKLTREWENWRGWEWVCVWMVKGTQKDNEIRLLFSVWSVGSNDHDCKCKCSDELCRSFFFYVVCMLFSFFFAGVFFSLFFFSLCQSLRFFAFGSFTFLFYHFHVVCSHHNSLSLSLPFFFFVHFASVFLLPTRYPLPPPTATFCRSLAPLSWVFLSLAALLFFYSNNFFSIYSELALKYTESILSVDVTAAMCAECEESVVWCKHNLSHYPKPFCCCCVCVCFFSILWCSLWVRFCHLPAHA